MSGAPGQANATKPRTSETSRAAVTALLDVFWIDLTIACLQDVGAIDCLTPGALALAPLISSTAGLLLLHRVRARNSDTRPQPFRAGQAAIAAVLLGLPLLWLMLPLLLNPF